MRRNLTRVVALALLAVAPLAPADVVLTGNQHIGDCDDAGGGCTGFTPLDPVSRNQMFNYPFNFSPTTTTTVDKVRLDGAFDLDGRLQIYLETRGTSLGSSSSHFGTLSGSTFDLVPDLVLAPGDYVIFPDGGCSESSGSTFFYNCPGGKVNDFGFSSITLESTQSSTSIVLNQRRHLGDNSDSDDDYDFTGNVSTSNGEFYPDAVDGATIDLSFSLSANLRLTQLKFYRLRDVNTESPSNATAPKVLVNGSQIGELTTDGDPFTLTLANSLLLTSGTPHTLRVESGLLGAQRDDISWDGIVMEFASTTTAGTPGAFNAVDVGGNALSGSITTKTAGGAFTLDLYALNGFGTGQDTSYAGIASVDLLDASDSSGTIDVYGCNSEWEPKQTLSAALTFVAGYAQVSGTFLTAGLKDARIKVTDSTTGAKGCSIDNFAIGPASLNIVPSHATETTAGTTTALTNTATTGLPRHRAGQPFTIIATGVTAGGTAVTNYDGSPTATTPVVIAPATVAGTLTLGSWGLASGGARRTDTATYSEIGAVTITLEDTAWANIDADDPTSTAAERTITGSVNTGRFVPDHFKVTDGTLAPACTLGGFSYLGSTLTWASPAVTLTAESASNQTTQNYAGTLMRLAASDVGTPTYSAPTGALSTLGTAVSITTPGAGQAAIGLPDLQFARTLMGAFDAEILVDFPEFDGDADDIRALEHPLKLGETGGVAFTANAKSQRFGRLYLEPKYGSELMPLDVPLRAEYFDGVTFVPNLADSCTTLAASDITLVPAVVGQSKTLTSHGSGRWTVQLSAPLDDGQATLSIDLASPPVSPTVPYPLLTADTDANGTYAEDPTTTVTFGLHTQDDKRIYSREVVGN